MDAGSIPVGERTFFFNKISQIFRPVEKKQINILFNKSKKNTFV